MGSNKAKTATIVFAVIIVLGLSIMAYLRGPAGPAASVQPQPQFAPAGELTSGFPRELILGDNAKVESGFSVSYSSNINQETANFISDSSLQATADGYKTYLEKNGWTITNEITKYADSRGIYAKKGADVISVAIVDQGKMRQVSVSYVNK